jgi:hypothetical protein
LTVTKESPVCSEGSRDEILGDIQSAGIINSECITAGGTGGTCSGAVDSVALEHQPAHSEEIGPVKILVAKRIVEKAISKGIIGTSGPGMINTVISISYSATLNQKVVAIAYGDVSVKCAGRQGVRNEITGHNGYP